MVKSNIYDQVANLHSHELFAEVIIDINNEEWNLADVCYQNHHQKTNLAFRAHLKNRLATNIRFIF